MDEHISSCTAVYTTVIDLIHRRRAEKFLKTSNVLFCYRRGRRPGWDCYVLIKHEPLLYITNTSTLGCSGHLPIRFPGDCLPLGPLNFIGLGPPLAPKSPLARLTGLILVIHVHIEFTSVAAKRQWSSDDINRVDKLRLILAHLHSKLGPNHSQPVGQSDGLG